ncbi:GET complex subunit get2 [Meyerozyma guilliermondii]
MAKGGASDRLNKILSQGSSVKTSAVSVLDQPQPADHDPEGMDISTIASKPTPEPELDIDAMLNSVLGGNMGAGGAANGDPGSDPFTQMMMNMMQGGGPEGMLGQEGGTNPMSANMEYQQQLIAYNLYQQRKVRHRFLVVRMVSILANFVYHFLTISDFSFSPSANPFIRSIPPTSSVSSFFQIFVAIEAVLVAAYIAASRNVPSNNNGLLVKGISMAAMFVPKLQRFQPLIMKIIGCWDTVTFVLNDLGLVVLLFGLISFRR